MQLVMILVMKIFHLLAGINAMYALIEPTGGELFISTNLSEILTFKSYHPLFVDIYCLAFPDTDLYKAEFLPITTTI